MMNSHGMLSNGMDPGQNGEHNAGNLEWPEDGGDIDDDGGQFDGALPWGLTNDDTEFASDCDCPGLPPPPQFALPPPPVPFSASSCSHGDGLSSTSGSNALSDLEYCDMQVLEGPYTQTAIPSIAVIVVCSFLMLVMVLVASLLFWKHKRKMQNFLPCKTSPTTNCDLTGGSVLYEDLTNIRPRNLANHCTPNQTIAPMELLDVKRSNYGGAGFTSVGNTTFMYPPSNENHTMKSSKSKDHFNQAYEEVSASSDGKRGLPYSDLETEDEEEEEEEEDERISSVSSEGELAEDELSLVDYPKQAYHENANGGSRPCSGTSSLRGSTGDDLCRDFDSACSDENESRSGSKGTFRGAIERGFSIDGPAATSTEQKKKRRGKVRTMKGVDHVRSQLPSLPVIVDSHPLGIVPYPVNGRHDPGVDDRYDGNGMERSPKQPYAARLVRGGVGPPWRTPEMPLGYDGYHQDDPGSGMVLMIPPAHPPQRELPRLPSNSGLDRGISELNVPKLGHHPRNNVSYRDGDAREGHRIPSDEYGRSSSGSAGTWGPEASGSQRNSDPHERNIAEFSTFRPRKGSTSRDLYGLDVGMLNSDVGSHYAHLPASQRSSGSDGSKGSSNSVERLLPTADGGPYHHYHPQSHSVQQTQQQQQQQPHFLADPSMAATHRIGFPSHQRNKRKQTDKTAFGDLEPSYGARTVLT